MKRNIVIGPPGTGKTTFLKDKVDKLISGGHCRPDEIGYFSFTVKAAEEIRDRVTKEEWSEAELKKMYPYFYNTKQHSWSPNLGSAKGMCYLP